MIRLYVNQQFESNHQLKSAVKAYAVSEHFEFKTVKSDSTRYTVICKNEAQGCPWRLHASRLEDNSAIFQIKTLSTHNCTGTMTLRNREANPAWIASKISGKLKDEPSYSPKEMVADLVREAGVKVSYQSAWRGKEIAMKELHGSFEEGYRLLPKYCEKLKEANPGSIAFVDSVNGRFSRLFIALRASLEGFFHCRPVIGKIIE